jgi:hypothetical protein
MNNLFDKSQAQNFVKENLLSGGLDIDKSGGLYTTQGDITIREGCLSIIFEIEDMKIANKVLKILKPYLHFRNRDAI